MSEQLELNDLSPCPFGKYENLPMQDVPVDYLHWAWHSFLKNLKESDVSKMGQVAKYVRDNKEVLKKEDEDLIWS